MISFYIKKVCTKYMKLPNRTRQKRRPKYKRKTRRESKQVFTHNEYKANDGMMTSIWGPSLWHFLHTISFNYPVKPLRSDKKHYKEFMYSLKHILPCKYCRDNLNDYYKKYPLHANHLKDRDSFSKYIYRLHEDVNKRLHKKSGITYYEVRDLYEHFRARCSKETKKRCSDPLNGRKSKCVLSVVPIDKKCKTFNVKMK